MLLTRRIVELTMASIYRKASPVCNHSLFKTPSLRSIKMVDIPLPKTWRTNIFQRIESHLCRHQDVMFEHKILHEFHLLSSLHKLPLRKTSTWWPIILKKLLQKTKSQDMTMCTTWRPKIQTNTVIHDWLNNKKCYLNIKRNLQW